MNFTHTADVNAQHLQRIKSSLENMSLLKGALQIFQHCDRERKGYLTWEHGEVYVFISKVFEQQGLVPPSQEQIRSLFQAFDSNRNGCLEPKEGLCLVDALARAIILAQSPQGYPKSPPKASSYSLAEEWLTSFQPPAMAVEVNYGGTEPVNLQLLAAHIKPVLSQNSRHRSRMVAAIESGELLKESMRLFKQCDADRNGKLTWNEGEIRRFISQVLQHYNLVEQLYEIYRHFDRDRSYSLDVRESLCLVDAVVRAMYVSPTHSVGSRPSREVGSPPIRRAAMTDEELARRVAHQDAAMEKKIERLIRACSDSVALRVSTGVMHVMFSAWRQCATKDLFARAKQGWDRQCEELSAAAEKAKRRLEEEQRGFEDELERMEQRRVLDTTASLSAREAAEVAAEAEEEAIRKHLKERQLWEARMKEERQQRERLEREFRDSLQLAEAQAEERAEARFVQERQLYEERLKEERDRRVRAETAKAQALDHWAEEARKLKKNAVQQVMANWLPKNSKEQVARQLRGIAGKWLELAKAGGRRRGRLTALDKAVMSWGRKALSGRPGPSFHAWRDVIRAQRRAKAAVGVLSRQWLGGSKGLMASYMAEWRQLLAEKRQNELKAKRKARAHAQISLLVAQWERGQKAGSLRALRCGGLKDVQKVAVEGLAERLQKREGAEGEGLYDDTLALVRYLRARNWDLDLAEALIRKTGTWRTDFGFSKIFTSESEEDIAQEASFGNIYVRGYDKLGRPALYFKPGRDGFNAEPSGVKYLVYCLERAIACVDKKAKLGQLMVSPEDDPVARKFVLLVDFEGVGLGSLVPLTIVRDLMVVMQDHYPERLGLAFFVNTPWLLHSFFTAASTFLDPVTLAKFNFVSEDTSQTMEQHFDLRFLEKSFGGCDEEPFCSHIFLNTHSGEGVFGLEYAEQLHLSPQDLSLPDHSFEYVDFLHVYRHWRVLRLPSQKRLWLRQLAKQLSSRAEDGMDYFIEPSTLLRYLRVHDWDVDKAATAVCATARWRKEHIHVLGDVRSGRCSAAIGRECALGRFYLRGFDLRGRPIVYLKFHHEDSGHYQETINYVIYVMERLVALLRRMEDSQQEKEPNDVVADADCATVLVDFNGYSSSHRPGQQDQAMHSRPQMPILLSHQTALNGKQATSADIVDSPAHHPGPLS
eukprot:symbB.v1.2.025452.t1/scaffold2469.1/size78468/8